MGLDQMGWPPTRTPGIVAIDTHPRPLRFEYEASPRSIEPCPTRTLAESRLG